MDQSRSRLFSYIYLVIVAISPIFFFGISLVNWISWGSEANALHWPIKVFVGRSLLEGQVPLWNPYFFGGMPFLAHPEANVLYPLNLIFSVFPVDYAIYIYAILPFVISALTSYYFSQSLGISNLGSVIVAFVFTFNYSRLAKLGHIQLQHTVMWLPIQFYLINKIVDSQNWRRMAGFLILTLFIQGLGMHAQTFFYCLLSVLLLGMIKIGQGYSARRMIYRGGVILILGTLVLSVQLIPVLELLPNSTWRAPTENNIMASPIHIDQIVQIIHPLFPKIMDGQPQNAENVVYFGMLPLLLIVFSIGSFRGAFRWYLLMLTALILFPFVSNIRGLYSILPFFNYFRVPSRILVPGALLFGLLAGKAFDHIHENLTNKKILVISTAVLVMLFTLIIRKDSISKYPYFTVSITLSVIVIVLIAYRPKIISIQLALAFIIALDFLIIFATNLSGDPMNSLAKDAQIMEELDENLGSGRLWRQNYGPEDVSNSNLYGSYEQITSYNPLFLTRLQELTHFDGSFGYDTSFWGRSNNLVPDLLNIRYIYIPTEVWIEPIIRECHPDPLTACFVKSLPLTISPDDHVSIPLSEQLDIQQISLWSWLGNASQVVQGHEVATISLITDAGVIPISIRGGIHTAEWSIDCQGSGEVLHTSALEFSNVTSDVCYGRSWISFIQTPNLADKVKEIRISNTSENATLNVEGMIISTGTDNNYHVNNKGIQAKRDFSRLAKISGSPTAIIFERERGLPYAWGVKRVEFVNEEELLSEMRGDVFNPDIRVDSIAYIDVSEKNGQGVVPPLDSQEYDQNVEISLIEKNINSMKLQISANGGSFIVISEIFSPGWVATLNGEPINIHKVDYILRGLAIPEGNHELIMAYKPKSFSFGIFLSTIGLLIVGYLIFSPERHYR